MIRTVHKFGVDSGPFLDRTAVIELPPKAKLVLFESQYGAFYAWFEVLLAADGTLTKARSFRVFGTGHEIPDGWEHRASFQVHSPEDGGHFVWHLYELVEA